MYGERHSHIQSPNVFASPSYVTKNYKPGQEKEQITENHTWGIFGGVKDW